MEIKIPQKVIDNFSEILIEKNSMNSDLAKRIHSYFPHSKIKQITSSPLNISKKMLSPNEFNESKKRILIQKFKGRFFKKCPGSKPHLTCCNYFVLNLGLQCNMNCSYCYLQSFLNSPYLTIYSNIEDALSELRNLKKDFFHEKIRIGTGELIDSLSLDEISLYSRKLINFFYDFPNWSLEFKTKSDKVDQFLDLDHKKNIIVSFSMNPSYIIEKEEHFTASLEKRMKAAKKCLDKDFKIAFHIDPVIYHENWRENYSSLVKSITDQFKASDLPYISLGALRFQPEQRHIMRDRFDSKSLVNQSEMFLSSDGKFRYDKDLRSAMFSFIIDEFKSKDPSWKIFLCMEQPETWIQATQNLPYKDPKIKGLFKHQMTRKIENQSLEK